MSDEEKTPRESHTRFTNEIKRITGINNFRDAISEFTPIYYRYSHDNILCLCGRKIKHIYIFEYDDIEYNFGSSCCKRHYTDEQKKQIKIINTEYKKQKKNEEFQHQLIVKTLQHEFKIRMEVKLNLLNRYIPIKNFLYKNLKIHHLFDDKSDTYKKILTWLILKSKYFSDLEREILSDLKNDYYKSESDDSDDN